MSTRRASSHKFNPAWARRNWLGKCFLMREQFYTRIRNRRPDWLNLFVDEFEGRTAQLARFDRLQFIASQLRMERCCDRNRHCQQETPEQSARSGRG